jgi:hypothetical protein
MKKRYFSLFLLITLLFIITGCESIYIDDYTARGVVVDQNSNGISNVSVYFDDGSPIETREDGTWTKTGLKGKVVVRPQKSGYVFTPSNLTISHVEENNNIEFIGTKTEEESENTSYTVSGQITYNGNPLPGVTLQFSDDSSPVETDLEGDWEKSDLTGEVVITPQLEDWQFSQANRTVTSANDGVDFTAEPAENFSYYTLSGNVIDDDANGVPGVKIEIRRAADNTLLDIAFTGVSDGGSWTSSGLWGEVIITPIPASKDNISSFDPVSQTKSGEAQNVDFKAIFVQP